MAVLVEALSVIVRRESIDRKVDGGWEAFLRTVPNQTFCSDGELVRVGFMHPSDVGSYIGVLKENGLVFEESGRCVDIAVADQDTGFTSTCPWGEFTHLKRGEDGGRMAACWLYEGERRGKGLHFPHSMLEGGKPRIQVVLPAGWEFEGSLSQHHTFVPREDQERRLKFQRSEPDGRQVFLDTETGKEVTQTRTQGRRESDA